MKHIGIVGNEGAKFTPEAEEKARAIIRRLLAEPCVMVSGHCHLGGIDIWAEEEAKALGRETSIWIPAALNWSNGYKPRNIQIARKSDEVHCIVVATYPESYKGMRFQWCYHCETREHVKSGGCWTAKYAQKRYGKPAKWHVVA